MWNLSREDFQGEKLFTMCFHWQIHSHFKSVSQLLNVICWGWGTFEVLRTRWALLQSHVNHQFGNEGYPYSQSIGARNRIPRRKCWIYFAAHFRPQACSVVERHHYCWDDSWWIIINEDSRSSPWRIMNLFAHSPRSTELLQTRISGPLMGLSYWWNFASINCLVWSCGTESRCCDSRRSGIIIKARVILTSEVI